jgi:hypothetical protein
MSTFPVPAAGAGAVDAELRRVQFHLGFAYTQCQLFEVPIFEITD